MKSGVEPDALSLLARLAIGASLLCGTISAPAAVLTFPLGTSSFPDGAQVGSGTYTAASDVAPFNTFIGSDVSGPNLSTAWTFTYPQINDAIAWATILVSLYDDDSLAAGSQLATFNLNGAVDLRSALDTLMEAKQNGSGLIAYNTVDIPSSGFAQLASGNVTVNFAFQGRGARRLGGYAVQRRQYRLRRPDRSDCPRASHAGRAIARRSSRGRPPALNRRLPGAVPAGPLLPSSRCDHERAQHD